MTHPERDSDLLMLIHGELPPLAAWSLRLHLLRCTSCRERLQQHQAVSISFASAIRGPQMPRWSPPASGAAFGLLPLGLIAVGLALILLFGMLAVRSFHPAPARPAPVLITPCRPDLPSDRCN